MAASLWLPFNNSMSDSSGTTTVNSSVGVSYTTGKFGQCYVGDASSDRIIYNNPGNFSSSDDFTYMFWLNRRSTSTRVHLDHQGFFSGGGAIFYTSGSNYYCSIGGTTFNGSLPSGATGTNAWYHVAITRSNGTVRVFFNGSLRNSGTYTGARTQTAGLYIGNYSSGLSYGADQWIDDFVYIIGTALYTSSYTPPTSAYTETTNSAPTNITLSATSFNENIAANTTVATISTTDSDSGDSHTYSLVSGTGSTDNSAFNISGNSLRISSSPDYETQSSYSIRIRTTDSASATYEKAFTLTVNDLADTGLQTSGALSIGEIAVEFGGTTPHALSEYYGAATGVPSTGALAISDFYGKASAPACSPVGQATWTTAGSRTWTRPTNVTEVSVICVGGGGGGGMRDPDKGDEGGAGGGGGGLSYGTFTLPTGINSFTSVTGAGASPVTGDSAFGQAGGDSWFGYSVTTSGSGSTGASTITVGSASGIVVGSEISGTGVGTNAVVTAINGTTITKTPTNSGTVSGTLTFTTKLIVGGGGSGGQGGGAATGGSGGTSSGLERDGGGSGGRGGNYSSGIYAGGGGGAGGYTGNGGQGMDSNGSSYSYTGTGGSGGGAGGAGLSYGGGGVGYLGAGTSGAAQSSSIGNVGNAGSGGQSGQTVGSLAGGTGGWSGGGGGGCSALGGTFGGQGGVGVVRIIWGSGRSYPSTLTTDQTTVTC